MGSPQEGHGSYESRIRTPEQYRTDGRRWPGVQKANTLMPAEKGTQRVDWRLPGALEADCREGAGLPQSKRSTKWQNNLRTLLDRWVERGGKVEYDPADDVTRMCSMYVDGEAVEALECEAARLTEQTGKPWSTAAVVRLVWQQERGRR